jgi:tRNA pseudouridine55 synthase
MPAELNGIVVVDKPGGLSSARVVSKIKKLFGAKKVGHTGTLDPFATGVLICCINRATRLSQFFLQGDKTYEAVLRLGMETDTQDATGTVTARHVVGRVTHRMMVQTAERFTGAITQIPPVYSALKHQGIPLYKLARRGKAVEKPARRVRIDRIEILDVSLPEVRFRVSCSSGTYIRSLCADMGQALGCGGHLKSLRRTASCGFPIDTAISLDGLASCHAQDRMAEVLIGMSDALHFLPAVVADDTLARKIRHGQRLSKTDFAIHPTVSDQGNFKVVDLKGHLIAVMRESTAADRYNYCCVFSV